MSFFKLEKCDIIHSRFITYPNYSSSLSASSGVNSGVRTSGFYYLFSSSVGQSRTYSDINGITITGSYSLSGTIDLRYQTGVSSSEKRAIKRLQDLYVRQTFKKIHNYNSASLLLSGNVDNITMGYINIPHILYGTEIKPGSVSFSFFSSSNSSSSFKREFYDDGLGGFYESGSNELVGSVFYQHGIIYFTGTIANLLKAEDANKEQGWGEGFNPAIFFSGTNKSYVNIYNCKVPKGGLNFTQNPSYVSYLTSSNKSEITTKNPKTYITSIGFYDKNYNLIAVGKLANPALNEESTQILFKLKLLF